ncbi:MAG: mannose-6-phosphate isomerase, class I [Acidobacteriota bacterium]
MIGISKLDNPIQNYAWGSRHGIARFLGRPVPSKEPEAELWMGAHPKAPSQVSIADGTLGLDLAIREAPQDILGAEVAARYDNTLPFLFKVLAAGQALSIQAHPDASQARAGCRREDEAGLERSDARRNYRDAHHKPEVLYALTPFWILRGFRTPSEILELMEPLGLIEALPGLASALRAGDLRRFFSDYLALDSRDWLAASAPALDRIARASLPDDVESWVLKLARQFPGDYGILAPLFLHLLKLKPEDAIFTGPGVLHAYLDGVGIELMANSDNVVRGGLTPKHVDRDELLSILRFKADPPTLLSSRSVAGERIFEPVADEFALSVIEVQASAPFRVEGRGEASAEGRRSRSAELLLCAAGSGQIRESRGIEHDFSQGDSFLVPASCSAYRIEGSARLFRATVPDGEALG